MLDSPFRPSGFGLGWRFTALTVRARTFCFTGRIGEPARGGAGVRAESN